MVNLFKGYTKVNRWLIGGCAKQNVQLLHNTSLSERFRFPQNHIAIFSLIIGLSYHHTDTAQYTRWSVRRWSVRRWSVSRRPLVWLQTDEGTKRSSQQLTDDRTESQGLVPGSQRNPYSTDRCHVVA